MITAEIITTGNEVLEGRVLDTNASFAATELIKSGIDPRWRTTIGDYKEDLILTLQKAMKRANIVIVSGGLGPTEDDLTREVCAKLLGVKLIRCKRAVSHISNILAKYGRTVTETELRQAYFPNCNTTIVPNKNGTARGFICEREGKIISALSGVPSEFKEMLTNTVLPFLKKKFAIKPRLWNIFNTIGKSESEVQKIILPIFSKYHKICWGITAHHLIISVSLWTEPKYKNQFDLACKQLRAKLESVCFSEGETTLQETVISTLRKKRLTVAVAESCTGGLILDKLTDIPGASRVLMEGVVSYSNVSKVQRLGVNRESLIRFGAVSQQVAEEMAKGIRSSAKTDFGLSTTGIAGPTGSTRTKPVGLVYIAVASQKGVRAKHFTFSGSREDIKERASNAALAMLLTATKLRT